MITLVVDLVWMGLLVLMAGIIAAYLIRDVVKDLNKATKGERDES